ncbi:MAG: winged helix-turn-helix transcriptional regulator [Dehalococcoidia bacterium]|nr:winged helix-turn-helix transcriptional regulator [Dehalococcoidia bacterium]
MERRGSGLRKIIDQYPGDSEPVFRSAEQSFVVVLKKLNSNQTSVPVGTVNGTVKNAGKILDAILADPKITRTKLATETGLSVRTVARELKTLRETSVIRRVGPDRSGRWEVAE